MHRLLQFVFKYMNRRDIPYCLMRDYEGLVQTATPGSSTEIDLLVAQDHLATLKSLLKRIGFVQLPGRGYEPHHFFLTYDAQSDIWLKLDVIIDIAYGSPIKFLPTTLAVDCLNNRRRCGFVYVLSPEDELITLLLHCLLDKQNFATRHQVRLQALCDQDMNESRLTALMARYWLPGESWMQLAGLIRENRWELLLSRRTAVARRLRQYDRMGLYVSYGCAQIRRGLQRGHALLRPPGLSVALLAPDGAGKSTLAAQLQNRFFLPVYVIYMGLYKKNKIIRLGLPGIGFAWRVLTQWWRCLVARYARTKGRLVVFDRYNYDALLATHQTGSRLRRWAYQLLAYACPSPQLTLVLDAPGELLFSRKGEQSPKKLERQRQLYLALATRLPHAMVVDATQDAEQLRRQVTTLIWRRYGLK